MVCETRRAHERTRAGMPGKACSDRLPWVLCRDRDDSLCVVTDTLVLRQGAGKKGLSGRNTILVLRQGG